MHAEPASLIKRLFWGWDAPVVNHAADFLAQEWDPALGPLDLADTLLLVPTMEAGRRLKEALARETGRRGGGASVPWVWTPEQALLPPQARALRATPLQSQMAWQQALAQVPPTELGALFPTLPEERGWAWQVEMARLLAELKSLLGAGGLTLAEAAEHLPRDAARWQALGLLETACDEVLAGQGLQDAQTLKRQAAGSPHLPEGVQRVVILAAPDLPPLLTRWARQCAERGIRVLVAVQAPLSLADTFDELGRPLPAAWGEDAEVEIPLRNEDLALCHDAPAQAGAAVEWLRTAAARDAVAVGLGDPEVGAVLKERLGLEGVQVFEPGGQAPQSVALWHVLGQVRRLLATGSWRAFTVLLRVPEVRAVLTSARESDLRVLETADEVSSERMPVTLDHALELLRSPRAADEPELPENRQAGHDQLEKAVLGMAGLVAALRTQSLPAAARSLLTHFYGGRTFKPSRPEDHAFTTLADAWLGICEEIHEETARFGLRPQPAEAFSLSLEILGQQTLLEPRGEVDLVLQGWLELLWEPAPGLVITGMNEEHVPGIQTAHPFLPDKAREQLGLPCQATRFARDAYTLRALAGQRAPGSLRLLAGRWSERGDALRPSRLLLLCAAKDLPRRVLHLFPQDEAGAASLEPPRTLAWKLKLRPVQPKVETITPSRLRSYLACPFRDYLGHELKMEAFEPGKRELAASEFGTLAHHAFAMLGQDAAMKRSTQAGDLADFLIEAAWAETVRRHGKRPAPLIALQFESLRQQLQHAAEVEAQQREEGWDILHAELMVGGADDANPLLIEGARLRCKVDRVERHRSSGHIRVLDFKTSAKLTTPEEAHVKAVSKRSPPAEHDLWKTFEAPGGGEMLWLDLQLPLYAAALRHRGLRPDTASYFCLPKSVLETEVKTWADFNDQWMDRALECAAEIVRRLREGRFWPPARRAYENSYDEIFLGDIAATVAMEDPAAGPFA